MRSFVRVLGPAFLLIGAVLLVDALVTGAARLYLLLILPVVTGSSPLFGASMALLVAGFLLLPLMFAGPDEEEPHPAPTPTGSSPPTDGSGSSGGLVLIGPVPIFFGAWRRNPPISYRWAILLGGLLAVVAVLVLWGFSRL